MKKTEPSPTITPERYAGKNRKSLEDDGHSDDNEEDEALQCVKTWRVTKCRKSWTTLPN